MRRYVRPGGYGQPSVDVIVRRRVEHLGVCEHKTRANTLDVSPSSRSPWTRKNKRPGGERFFFFFHRGRRFYFISFFLPWNPHFSPVIEKITAPHTARNLFVLGRHARHTDLRVRTTVVSCSRRFVTVSGAYVLREKKKKREVPAFPENGIRFKREKIRFGRKNVRTFEYVAIVSRVICAGTSTANGSERVKFDAIAKIVRRNELEKK